MEQFKPLVRNAGDPEQVKRAGLKQSVARRAELKELVGLLEQPAFRKFYWRVLTHCKVFESVWRQSAEIHYLAGKQDVGHMLVAELTQANPTALILMMQEHNTEALNTDE